MIQGVLGLHEFLARNKFEQAKFVLVKLYTSTFSKLRTSENLSTCYLRNGLLLKIRASEIPTKGAFTNYVGKILSLFDHVCMWVDKFFALNVDKNWHFSNHVCMSSCRRSLWMAPSEIRASQANLVNQRTFFCLYVHFWPESSKNLIWGQ